MQSVSQLLIDVALRRLGLTPPFAPYSPVPNGVVLVSAVPQVWYPIRKDVTVNIGAGRASVYTPSAVGRRGVITATYKAATVNAAQFEVSFVPGTVGNFDWGLVSTAVVSANYPPGTFMLQYGEILYLTQGNVADTAIECQVVGYEEEV